MGETILAGGLEFYVENRTGSRDGGPSLQVRGTIDGDRQQLLRFDMFRVQPHYHYAPTGQDLRYNLDPLAIDDGIGWVMSLLQRKLPQLVAKAGYEDFAAKIPMDEAAAALPEIERRWRAQT
jgi:hypothetical protein